MTSGRFFVTYKLALKLLETLYTEDNEMRQFLYKLATRLEAPLWLRARLSPAETEPAAAVLPVVPEVRNFAEEIAAQLAELGIELFPVQKPSRQPKLGFFQTLVAVHHYWRGESSRAVAAAVAVAVGAAAGAVAGGAAAAGAVVVAVVAAAAAGAVVVAVVAAAARDEELSEVRKFLVVAFYSLLILTTLLLFIPAPWWADLLLPLLGLTWVGQAIGRMVRSRKTEPKEEIPPLTGEQLYNRAVEAVTAAVERHRTRVIDGDSALKKVIGARENDLEALKRVREELEVLGQRGDSAAYVESRLAEAEAGIAEVEQEIARATAAKEEFLSRLRRLEAHLPALNRFVVRRRIDETIVRIRSRAADFSRETDEAFLEELRLLRNEVAPLLSALERLTHALMGADETVLLEQMFEEVGVLGEESGKATKVLEA